MAGFIGILKGVVVQSHVSNLLCGNGNQAYNILMRETVCLSEQFLTVNETV